MHKIESTEWKVEKEEAPVSNKIWVKDADVSWLSNDPRMSDKPSRLALT